MNQSTAILLGCAGFLIAIGFAASFNLKKRLAEKKAKRSREMINLYIVIMTAIKASTSMNDIDIVEKDIEEFENRFIKGKSRWVAEDLYKDIEVEYRKLNNVV